jgi:dTDP-4-dehydrorhamnose reductase
MSSWLVTGAGGMLGTDLVAELTGAGHEVAALRREELDITDPAAVLAAVRAAGAQLVVNTAAYTDVDGAESHEDLAQRVNGAGAANLAAACAAAPDRPVLLQLSTDYVFDGEASTPYPEDAPTRPRTAYGRSKLAGERAVLETLPDRGVVLRTAWLYGNHGANFVATVLRLAAERDHLDIVDDQHGQPTGTRELAARVRELGERVDAGSAPAGIYHASAAGRTTWYGLARLVLALTGADPDRVRATTSERFPRPAPRPRFSVLGHDRWRLAGLAPMPSWDGALADYLRAT